MTPEEYEKVGELFFEVCDLDPEARAAFLDEACAGNRVVRKAVEGLLRCDGELNVADRATSTHEVPESWSDGGDAGADGCSWHAEAYRDRVGHFKILDTIGEGGMGVVYLAEQREPVRRRVALKVIKLGMDTREVVARFEAERQAMALMDHPAIASVYEAGSTVNGRPYFAMEFVQGLPFTAYCDRHRLGLRERLELFRQVCQGIHHAHLKGIIHRDIKPSNILVSTSDGEPRAKIIDFGIARATDQRLTEKTLYTEVGRTVGTPQYMSPEQAEMSTEDIDHRSDIYSLGVLLYEVLVGELPLDWGSLRKVALEEVLRRIGEEEPPVPSIRWSRLNRERTKRLAASRGTDPSSVQSALRGDLDWITMKALEKERERRYGTASELAGDIARQLRSEPVLAGPPSGWYVLRKTIRRHRARFAVASVILLLLAGGIVGTSVALVESRREQAKAVAASDFLLSMISAALPDNTEGRDVSLGEMLVGAARVAEEDLADYPEVRATVQHSLAATFQDLGRMEEAEEQARRAWQTRRKVLGEDHLDTLESLMQLAEIERRTKGDPAAQRTLREMLAIATRRWGVEHPLVIMGGVLLAEILLDSEGGDPRSLEEARQLVERALRSPVVEDEDSLYWTLLALSSVLEQAGDLDGSEEKAREARDLYLRQRRGETTSLAVSYIRLGEARLQKGDMDGAEEALADGLRIRERLLEPNDAALIHPALRLAKVYLGQKRYDEAEQLIERTLARAIEGQGIESHDATDAVIDLLYLLEARGDRERARETCREHLEKLEREVGRRHENAGKLRKILAALED